MQTTERVLMTLVVCLGVIRVACADSAADIVAASGVKGGLVVHIGCADGALTSALHVNDSYKMHGLALDPANVDRARTHIKGEGRYGEVTIDRCLDSALPYTDNIINLMVVSSAGKLTSQEIERVLAPRGVAMLAPGVTLTGFSSKTSAVKVAEQTWTRYAKPVPGNIDDWTHYLHGADGNAVAQDDVGSPFHMQWVDRPKFVKSHSVLSAVNVTVSAKGRMFTIVDEGPLAMVGLLPSHWTVVARDAFSGVVLWRRNISRWQPFNNPQRRMFPTDLHRRLVTDGDRVYVTLDLFGPTLALDASTGATIATYAETNLTQEIIVADGMVFVVCGTTPAEKVNRRQLADVRLEIEHKRIVAVQAETGAVRWTKDDKDTAGLMPLTLAARDKRVYFQNDRAVLCLSADTGEQLWRHERNSTYVRPGWGGPTLVVMADAVLVADRLAGSQRGEKSVQGAPGEIVALASGSGQELWRAPCAEGDASPTDVFCIDGAAWVGATDRRKEPDYCTARQIETGAVTKRFEPATNWPTYHHHRCYRDKATKNFILAGRTGVEFIDLDSGVLLRHDWIRGNCKHGILPCNGLLYVMPDQCACYVESKLNGLWALAPARPTPLPKTDKRLEMGPAYGKVTVPGSGNIMAAEWPTYRHDTQRSGHAHTSIAKTVQKAWCTPVGHGLSQPVVAAGKLFVASASDHTVHALDADTGECVWQFMAGGAVDSPPTIADGMAVFGSTDGYVYAINASDGKLAWRFRAAPADRRALAYGRLESVWPVHGSVLVKDHKVYCAAGRSSYIDGGMYFVKLDLATGKLLHERNYYSRDPKTGATKAVYRVETDEEIMPNRELAGLLPDILSSDEHSIYMRQAVMDDEFRIKDGYETHLFSSVGFLDDNWWERTFWQYGKHFYSSCFVWGYSKLIEPAGRILVLDANNVYGYSEAHAGVRQTGGISLEEPKLFAVERSPEVMTVKQAVAALPERARNKLKKNVAYRKVSRFHHSWDTSVPVVPRAMTSTDSFLFSAGPRAFDVPRVANYFATNRTDDANPPELIRNTRDSFAGTRGSLLAVTEKATGKLVGKLQLDSCPVHDGMIAANGRLYVSTVDGSVLCLAAQTVASEHAHGQ